MYKETIATIDHIPYSHAIYCENILNPIRSVGLFLETHRIWQGGWPPIAIMPGARHNQVGKCTMLAIVAGPN